MNSNRGFIELTAATVFGLVALAASAVGVLIGSIAVQKGPAYTPQAQYRITGGTFFPSGYTLTYTISPEPTVYESRYQINGTLCRGNVPGSLERVSWGWLRNSTTDRYNLVANPYRESAREYYLPGRCHSDTIVVDLASGFVCPKKAGVQLYLKNNAGGRENGPIITFGSDPDTCPEATLTPAPTLPAGVCVTSNDCLAGQICCRNRCVNPRNDPENCGSCANRCGANQDCVNGTCVARPTPTNTPIPAPITWKIPVHFRVDNRLSSPITAKATYYTLEKLSGSGWIQVSPNPRSPYDLNSQPVNAVETKTFSFSLQDLEPNAIYRLGLKGQSGTSGTSLAYYEGEVYKTKNSDEGSVVFDEDDRRAGIVQTFTLLQAQVPAPTSTPAPAVTPTLTPPACPTVGVPSEVRIVFEADSPCAGAGVTQFGITGARDGDLNGDGVINSLDFDIFLSSMGARCGASNYNPMADFDNNCYINALDASTMLQNF